MRVEWKGSQENLVHYCLFYLNDVVVFFSISLWPCSSDRNMSCAYVEKSKEDSAKEKSAFGAKWWEIYFQWNMMRMRERNERQKIEGNKEKKKSLSFLCKQIWLSLKSMNLCWCIESGFPLQSVNRGNWSVFYKKNGHVVETNGKYFTIHFISSFPICAREKSTQYEEKILYKTTEFSRDENKIRRIGREQTVNEEKARDEVKNEETIMSKHRCRLLWSVAKSMKRLE